MRCVSRRVPCVRHATHSNGTPSSPRGRGTVYSYVMPQHPPMPFMDYRYIVALIELDEGVRLVSNLCEIAPDAVEVGMPVEVFYETFDAIDGNDVVLHQFRPAR